MKIYIRCKQWTDKWTLNFSKTNEIYLDMLEEYMRTNGLSYLITCQEEPCRMKLKCGAEKYPEQEKHEKFD